VCTIIPSVEIIHDTDFNTVGYKITDADPDKLRKAAAIVETSMVPIHPAKIEERIAIMVELISVSSQFGPQQMKSKTEVLADELAKYPADIVIYAFEQVIKTAKFWPSFAEFYKYIRPLYEPRKLLLNKLHKCIENGR